jgi:ketosteroid isomerase-like protein
MTSTRSKLSADERDAIHRLTAYDGVRGALYRYFRGVDRQDWALAKTAYHTESIDSHGIYYGPGAGMIDFLSEHRDSMFEYTYHAGSCQRIELDGDVARVETYGYSIDRAPAPAAGGPKTDFSMAARLADRVELRDGIWAIAHRILIIDFGGIYPVVPFDLPPEAVLGTDGPDDPSYSIGGVTVNYMPSPVPELDDPQLLASLLAKEEIRNLIATSCRALDRFDWEQLRACYHDDATEDRGFFAGSADEFVAFSKSWLTSWIENSSHRALMSHIDLRGDLALVETLVQISLRGTPPQAGEAGDVTLAGRFLDRIERRGGQWKLSKRTLVFDATRFDALAAEYEHPPSAIYGTRDRNDPSYSI